MSRRRAPPHRALLIALHVGGVAAVALAGATLIETQHHLAGLLALAQAPSLLVIYAALAFPDRDRKDRRAEDRDDPDSTA